MKYRLVMDYTMCRLPKNIIIKYVDPVAVETQLERLLEWDCEDDITQWEDDLNYYFEFESSDAEIEDKINKRLKWLFKLWKPLTNVTYRLIKIEIEKEDEGK